MRSRIFTRKGWYYIETERGKSLSLHTKDRDTALQKIDILGFKKLPCPYCKSTAVPSHRKYCSDICRERFNNEIERYGMPRQVVLDAYENKCAVCGDTDNLLIHHVDGHGIPVKRTDRNNDCVNLIVICSGCHAKIHLSKNAAIPGAQEFFIGNLYPHVMEMIIRQMKSISLLKNACKLPVRFPADSMHDLHKNDVN